MKTRFLIFPVVIGFTLVTTNSCNKGDQPTPQTIDSIKSMLPKQVIWTSYYDTTNGPETYTFNITYDTLNRQITIDVTDTINRQNSGKINYKYNENGYLIKYTTVTDFANSNRIVTIVRAADNKIRYIINDNSEENRKDTTFFTYTVNGDGTQISASVNYHYPDIPEQTVNTSYTFDNKNKILYQEEGITQAQYEKLYSWNYDYNTNNSISKITSIDYIYNNFTNIATYNYTSGIPEGKEDFLYQLVSGKDYFIPDIGRFYVFSFQDYVAPYSLSSTDSYHVTSIEYPDSRLGQISDKWNYELNDNQLVSKIIFNVNNKISDVVIFKY